jgi:hypothetical protein
LTRLLTETPQKQGRFLSDKFCVQAFSLVPHETLPLPFDGNGG